ncbi:sigma factor-like helix-turn-helix DNA-binding protein [Candidatus Epulonipiscium viviparus]|uniref:sigma factor-like helix-turn-helix DNA-binding protein n=1 Tax=Candidatus Epulonipiscium viviparus TaxID=420336 RepID=UPI0027380702|nr:sigma factor-like helix-turn-helix DNA-binding protein [Candidatus Epulopiscium viviparus]
MQKVVEISYLFDFYQNLFTQRQKDLISGYYFEDLTLSELGDMYKISRQSVHETIKNAEIKLLELEYKLGFVKRFQNMRAIVDKIDKTITVPLEEQDVRRLKNLISELKNEV